MSDNAHIPPGWYPDPSGAPQQQRWWDGTQWSQTTQAVPAAPAWQSEPTAAPYVAMAPYAAAAPYSYNSPAFATATGANPNTPGVWGIVFTPLIVFIEIIILFGMGQLSVDAVMDPTASMDVVNGADLVTRLVGYLLVIGFAIADHHVLLKRGVDRPFHWAYAFLGIVYMIGRTVVVKRRTGRGLVTLFVWVGCVLVSYAVPIIVGIAIGLASTIPTY